MIFPNPVFLYMLFFYFSRPKVQKELHKIEASLLTWPFVKTSIHPMGGRKFAINDKEFGHIHWNGDLDILFDSDLVDEIIEQGLAKTHRFVPGKAITYQLWGKNNISEAINLLKLSYLYRSLSAAQGDDRTLRSLKKEITTLPFTESIIDLVCGN